MSTGTDRPAQGAAAAHDAAGGRGPEFAYRWVQGEGGSGLTLVLLHGTGGNEASLIPLGRSLAPGANLLGVRGRVLENGMPRFFRRLAEGVFDQEDLAQRTDELAGFLAAAARHHGFGLDSAVALGYSNGANIAASLLLRRPATLRRAILLRAMVPFTPDTAPDLSGAAVLILSGRRDPIVPVDQPDALAGILRSAGAEVTLEWQPAGHELTDGDLIAARHWLVEHTRPSIQTHSV